MKCNRLQSSPYPVKLGSLPSSEIQHPRPPYNGKGRGNQGSSWRASAGNIIYSKSPTGFPMFLEVFGDPVQKWQKTWGTRGNPWGSTSTGTGNIREPAITSLCQVSAMQGNPRHGDKYLPHSASFPDDVSPFVSVGVDGHGMKSTSHGNWQVRDSGFV